MSNVNCPVCGSMRIVIVVSPRRRAFCASCGARWLGEGRESVLPTPAAPATTQTITRKSS